MGTTWSILSSVRPQSFGDSCASGSASPVKTSAKSCAHASTHQEARIHPKRRTPLTTIRKLIRLHRRKVPSNQSYVRAFSEVAANWTDWELSRLVDTFETTLALRELYTAALTAHPPVNYVTKDLGNVLTLASLSDIRVWYKGVAYPAHRAILCARSCYFQEELTKSPTASAVTLVELDWHALCSRGSDFVKDLLVLIYTGQNPETYSCSSRQAWTKVKEYYGIRATFLEDIAKMQDVSPCYDATLTFARAGGTTTGAGILEEGGLGSYPCHQVVLAARSSFFRNLLVRKKQTVTADRQEPAECDSQDATARLVIALDDSIISHRFGKLLLKVLYEGTVDLACIMARRTAASSLSEARAIVSGGCSSCGNIIDESMELYHVGKFLDLSSLTHGAETIIADNLSIDNVASILAWAREPSGSDWVRRQCLHFIEEQFMPFVHSPGFVNIDGESLRAVLLSDFVQAPEMEVLGAVVLWSEYQLVKQREMKEPNLLANTAHSICRRPFRRRDMCGAELNSIVGEFAPYLRVGHLVPPTCEMLSSIVRRGILLCQPLPPLSPHQPGTVCVYCCAATSNSACSWLSGCCNQGGHCSSISCCCCKGYSGSNAVPRAYVPFYQEAKRLLEERTRAAIDGDVVRARRPCPANVPRAGGGVRAPREPISGCVQPALHSQHCLRDDLMALDSSGIISRVLTRVADLLQGHLVRSVLARRTDRATVCTLVCLWGLHEADLPDHLACMLQPHVEQLVLHCDEAETTGRRCPKHCLNKDGYLNGGTCGNGNSSCGSNSIDRSSRTSGCARVADREPLTAVVPGIASSLSSLDCGLAAAARWDTSSAVQQRSCSTWGASTTLCCGPDVTVSNVTNVKCDTMLSEHRAATCRVPVSAAGDLRSSFPDVTLHSHSDSLNEG